MNVLEMCCSWGMQLTAEISRPTRLPISEPINHLASRLSAWLGKCFPTCHLPCLWKNSDSSHSPSASAVLLLFLPVEALPSPHLHSTTINTALRLYCFVWSSATLGVQAVLLRSNSRDEFPLQCLAPLRTVRRQRSAQAYMPKQFGVLLLSVFILSLSLNWWEMNLNTISKKMMNPFCKNDHLCSAEKWLR